MNLEELLRKKIESYKDDFDFRLESFIFDLTERISKRMKERNISRSKLAELLGISPPAVTKILNGNSNFTLKTLLSLADALELDLKIDFKEKEVAPSIDYKPSYAAAAAGATELPEEYEYIVTSSSSVSASSLKDKEFANAA